MAILCTAIAISSCAKPALAAGGRWWTDGSTGATPIWTGHPHKSKREVWPYVQTSCQRARQQHRRRKHGPAQTLDGMTDLLLEMFCHCRSGLEYPGKESVTGRCTRCPRPSIELLSRDILLIFFSKKTVCTMRAGTLCRTLPQGQEAPFGNRVVTRCATATFMGTTSEIAHRFFPAAGGITCSAAIARMPVRYSTSLKSGSVTTTGSLLTRALHAFTSVPP